LKTPPLCAPIVYPCPCAYAHTTKHSAATSYKLKEMSVVVCIVCSYILVISADMEFMTESWYSKWRN